jgi:hypothetical protein
MNGLVMVKVTCLVSIQVGVIFDSESHLTVGGQRRFLHIAATPSPSQSKGAVFSSILLILIIVLFIFDNKLITVMHK